MNIFKLLGFKKILLCFLKACLIILFNTFFLLILFDEFIELPIITKITWFRHIYFIFLYSILFYLFCFYIRKDLDKLEELPKLKIPKKKFLEEFEKDNIKKFEEPIKEKETNFKKTIVFQKKKRKISKRKLVLKIFSFLFIAVFILGMLLLNPWTYFFIILLLILWNAGGLFGKILTIFLTLFVLSFFSLIFLESEDEENLSDI